MEDQKRTGEEYRVSRFGEIGEDYKDLMQFDLTKDAVLSMSRFAGGIFRFFSVGMDHTKINEIARLTRGSGSLDKRKIPQYSLIPNDLICDYQNGIRMRQFSIPCRRSGKPNVWSEYQIILWKKEDSGHLIATIREKREETGGIGYISRKAE